MSEFAVPTALASRRSTRAELRALLGLGGEGEREAGGPFRGITTLEAATPDDVSFVADRKYLAAAVASRAGLLLLPAGLAARVGLLLSPSGQAPDALPAKEVAAAGALAPRVLIVPHIWPAVLALLRFFHPAPQPRPGVHPSAVVESGAQIDPTAEVGPFCFIEAGATIGPRALLKASVHIGAGATIGADCRLDSHTVVRHGCRLGERCRLGPGATIGYDGFKTERIDGRHVSMPQIGIAVLEDDVELGAHTCVDRASFAETRIGARTKCDNLVQVGHNVTIGSDCLLCAQVGIAGSVRVGDGVMMGGQVGIADNISIAAGTILLGQTGVLSPIETPGAYFGSPAMPHRHAMRVAALLPRLPDLARDVERLVKSQG